jgi:O-antigen ligase
MYINLCIAFNAVRLFVDRQVNILNVTALLVFSGFQLMIGSINAIVVMGMIWVFVWLFGQARARNLNLRTSLYMLVPLVVLTTLIFTVKPLRQRFIVNTEYQYEWDHVGYWTGITFRLAIWSCASEVVGENFLTGVGTGDADLALNAKYREKNFVFGYTENYNAHNQYMQTWIMHGIPGILILLLVVVAPFYWSWRQGDVVLGIFAVIIALALCTEVTLGTQKGIAFFAVFFALLSKCTFASGRQLQDTPVNV